MKVNALILCVLVVVTVCFACAQPQAPIVTGPEGPTPRACTTDYLLGKVQFLKIPFNPQVNSSPTPDTSLTVDGNFYSNLKDAFNIAQPPLKNQLCDLTYIFLDPTDCAQAKTCMLSDDKLATHSWGLRGYQNGDTGKYIATSAGLWQNGGPAPIFSVYETRRLGVLLSNLSQNAPNWPYPPAYVWNPDTSAMTVLAALAHELGHVYWYDAFVSQRGGQVDKIDTFCKGKNKHSKFYSPGSWRNMIYLPLPPGKRWIDFGEVRNIHYPDYLTYLKSDLDSANFIQSAEDIHSILQAPNLVSVLAAFSPDEDFVETYQLKVINDTNTFNSLVLQIYDSSHTMIYSEDILAKFKSGTDIDDKAKCFS